MPRFIANILDSRASLLLARVVLTFVFWSSGLAIAAILSRKV